MFAIDVYRTVRGSVHGIFKMIGSNICFVFSALGLWILSLFFLSYDKKTKNDTKFNIISVLLSVMYAAVTKYHGQFCTHQLQTFLNLLKLPLFTTRKTQLAPLETVIK